MVDIPLIKHMETNIYTYIIIIISKYILDIYI